MDTVSIPEALKSTLTVLPQTQ